MHGTTRYPKPDYQPDHFIDRKEALELVLNKARRIAKGELVKRRVVVFRGPRGAGKTWLLGEYARQAPSVAICSCCQQVRWNSEVQELRRILARQPRPLMLLLDVDGATDEMLDELANRVLGRLVTDIRVLIVIAERGKGHYWARPEIRETSQEVDLGPFEVPYIQAQIQRQVPGATLDPKDILKWGGGFPWANYLLAVDLDDNCPPLERCVGALLEGINGKLRHQFAALSVLRSFDEDRMAPLLAAYSDDFRQRKWPYRACRDLALELVRSTLARYDSAQNGYIIDEPLHQALDALLWNHDRERWADLHQAAYEMYHRRADDPRQGGRWQAEREYHADCLKRAGRPLPETQEKGEENGR